MAQCANGTINFFINGIAYSVNPEKEDFNPDTPLVDFIRGNAGLTGTKTMCRAGGCGVCVVNIRIKDPVTGKEITKSVNSCLTPLLSCNGWDISTVERLGNKKVGVHKIQERLMQFNGSQCGFCTPGMVMNMYSLLNSKDNLTVLDVHNAFDGNICRCTGYRAILDTFKSFAVDAPADIRSKCQDIEEKCSGCPCAPKAGSGCCRAQATPTQAFNCNSALTVKLTSGQEWVQAVDLESALGTLDRFAKDGKKYRVVAGNTGTGVFKFDGPYGAYLNVNNVAELKKTSLDTSGVVLGGGISLTTAIQVLSDASKLAGFEYTEAMSQHMTRIANTPVRNVGTIAGNLMLKHAHNDFPSDMFLIMETVGAKINIGSSGLPHKLFTMTEFLELDMTGKLIVSLYLPQRKGGYHFRSFKVCRRYQNAHAYVNAGFLFKVDPAKNFLVLEKPRIIYGGIHPKFVHASTTELYLMGKELGDKNALKGAMDSLDKEIHPVIHPPDATPEYRKTLTKSTLYKAILEIIGEKLTPSLKSGGPDVKREVGRGTQTYDRETKEWVMHRDIPKAEIGVQVTGEAEFVNDIPLRPNELHGAFVISTVGNADFAVDASEALKLPGVVAFINANDIPGKNDFMTGALFLWAPMEEPIFAKGHTSHAGQSLGLIVAQSNSIALEAVGKVKVNYSKKQPCVVNLMDAVKKAEKDGTLDKVEPLTSKAAACAPIKTKHTIKGQWEMGSQYHFHMEPQSCVCVPREDGMDVYSASQWTDQAQSAIALALAVPANSINVTVRRLGGGFGGKITKAVQVSAACAVAAHKLDKPVRVILDMETNMHMIGKRYPYFFRYEIGVDDDGKIGNFKLEAWLDAGVTANEQDFAIFGKYIQNVYKVNGWEIKGGPLFTAKPANTFIRGPGTTEAIACMEYVMDHISHALKKDPLQVRMINMMKTGDLIFPFDHPLERDNLCLRIIDEIKISSDFEARRASVEKFNKENRWKKRGIYLMPVRYIMEYMGANFPVTVVIYHHDASVGVSHGGTEMGQGINTKVAQAVAYTLKIPIEKVKVIPTNSFNAANTFFTGASFTSELCCSAAIKACKILLDRLEPIKAGLEDKSWDNLVMEGHKAFLDLQASHMYGPRDKERDYQIWAVNVTEVEVDILTGEYKVSRVDITIDAGKSMNPMIDMGQIEGAYVMGQGLWTSEKLVYNGETGELLTNNTWEYKPPASKDVPEDFRITMLSNVPNPDGILRSKATGEPPLTSAFSVFLALRNAIDSARRDAGNTDWYQMDAPVTPEDVVRLALTNSTQFGY